MEPKACVTIGDHQDVLSELINSGAISLRNPMTGIPSELGWVSDAESWLMTRAHEGVLRPTGNPGWLTGRRIS